jgi:hypothetical protein
VGNSGVWLWDVNFDSWRCLARRIVNRNLTRSEWRQYFPNTPYRPTFDDLPVPPETDTGNMLPTPPAAAPDVPK